MDKWVENRQLQVHFVSAAGLVYKDGKVLLLRSERRGWEFPGGVVEQGETILDGLRREIREETGVTAEPRCLAGIYQRLTQRPGYGPLEGMLLPTNVSLVFICDYTDGTPAAAEESLEAGWYTPEEAGRMITNPHFRKALADTLAYDGKVTFGAFRSGEDGTTEQVSNDRLG